MDLLRGEWIWQGDDPSPYHSFVQFRRVIVPPATARTASIRITATDRYRLWINGTFVGRGPARGDARRQTYDTHELTSHLVAGANSVTVLGYFYGTPTATTRDGRAGLLAEITLGGHDGGRLVIPTDGAWKVRAARGWRRDAAAAGIGVGITEVYDARLDDPAWIERGFDDTGWEAATVIPAQSGPWSRRLEPRPIPPLGETVVAPIAIAGTGEILQLEDSRAAVDIAEVLARDPVLPAETTTIEDVSALLDPTTRGAVMRLTDHAMGRDPPGGVRAPFVILDFGEQINAFFRLHLVGPAGAIVDVSYTEELVGGRVVPLMNSTRAADRYILREGEQRWESFEYRSFRYVQLTVRNTTGPVRIVSVAANRWRYPAALRGAFRSSDALLTRLWEATVRTTDLCTDDAFMDSPFREKRNWLGDGSHAVLGALAVWGDTPVVRRYFDLALQGSLGDGLLRIFYPGSDFIDPKTRLPMTIPQHILVYAARVGEHWRWFGDRGLLASQAAALTDLARWADRHVDDQGLLTSLPHWNWLDWTPADLRGANFATNAFYLGLLDDLAATADVLGSGGDWARRAAALRRTLATVFWDGRRGRYADSLWRGKLTGIASQLGNALALRYGVAAPEQVPSIVRAITGDPSLAPATPLFIYYVIDGLAASGHTADALRLLCTRFGPMLERGGTLREGWTRFAMMPQLLESTPGVPDVVPDGDYRTVLPAYLPGTSAAAHCGALGVGFFLVTEILGVRPRGPGFRDGCHLRPRIDLLPEVSGVFPSPRGDIRLEWRPVPPGVEITVDLPAGMTGVLEVPGREGAQRLDAGRRTFTAPRTAGSP